jgi:hypothetical protein
MSNLNANKSIRYESRKDKWFTIIIWLTILICFFTIAIVSIKGENLVFDIIFTLLMLGTVLFLLFTYYDTYYILSDKELFIKSGFIKQTIPLETIKELKKVTDILSSPALSVKRIRITHQKSFVGVQISPEDRDEFLTEINARIKTITKD